MNTEKETGKIKVDLVYDARGLLCPIPVIGASERIRNMDAGEVIEVISDDPGIQEDMPAWCRSTGHTLLALVKDGRDYRLYIEKISLRNPE